MKKIIKRLKEANKELLNKFGDDSYQLRCELAGIVNEIQKKKRIKKLHIQRVTIPFYCLNRFTDKEQCLKQCKHCK
tara:strand:+ start:1372 stop:1599 length:228 start_codon:yes stop_codon:yes gene_type:complete